jgi:integrase
MREEKPRERALSKKELTAVLGAGAQEGPEARAFLLLVAYTGQRAGAVAAAEWSEFDLEARTWRIPAAEGRKFKGHDRLLPLNDGAMRALGILQEEVKPDPIYLFPARGGARGKTYSGWHNLVRRLRKRAGVEGWSIHTFRSTFRGLAVRDLKVRADVCDLVLGHSIGTTGFRFYEADKLTFGLSEKKEALASWGSYLDRVVREGESNG